LFSPIHAPSSACGKQDANYSRCVFVWHEFEKLETISKTEKKLATDEAIGK
jgi:hypothetical protein